MKKKPFSQASENNKDHILKVLKEAFADTTSVLEIGSGTGQHAVYFAEHMPDLLWHTSDLTENHAGIELWIKEANLGNILGPYVLDVSQPDWPRLMIDSVFSANAVHIMSWECVCAFFSGVGELLSENGLLILYGPFNYDNEYTSRSNADFDIWLKKRDPRSAIRNFGDLDQLAKQQGMVLLKDVEMPSNNRILCWQKRITNV